MFSLVAFAIIGAFLLLVWFSAWLCRKIAISVGAGRITARIAAIFGASIVLVAVFWDVPPTLIAHRYYCATDAGVRVYKSPLQWYAEKSGRAIPMPPQIVLSDEDRRLSSVWPSEDALRSQGLLVMFLQDINAFLTVKLERSVLLDQQSGEVLVEHRDYSAFSDGFKRSWFLRGGCVNLGDKQPNFKNVKKEFERIG